MRLLEPSVVQQFYEDAQEICAILTTASTDCRMSLDLRQRLAAVKERAEARVASLQRVRRELEAVTHGIERQLEARRR